MPAPTRPRRPACAGRVRARACPAAACRRCHSRRRRAPTSGALGHRGWACAPPANCRGRGCVTPERL
eukprot:4310863-Pleurochrysis_carterae.AAC.1